jgi:N-acetylglucosamine-6-phosphate deacetylase
MSSDLLMTGARAIDADGDHPDSWLAIRDGRIAGTGVGEPPVLSDEVDRIDVAGAIVTPGLVDIHVHGGGGHSFDDGPDAVLAGVAAHRPHGVSAMVASLVSASRDDLEHRLEGVRIARLADPTILGAHLEGPCLSPSRRGAHDPDALAVPDADFLALIAATEPGLIRQVTIAPELPGALDAIESLVAHGIRVAIGHTEADFDLTCAALDRGASLLTHALNAMPGIGHREPGPVPAALADERATLELILDGVHVHPSVAAMLLASAPDRIVLVSDAMAAAAHGDGDYLLGGLDVRVAAGRAVLADGVTIAGSTLTLDRAVRSAIVDLGLPLSVAVGAATRTPALAIGETTRGLLAPGHAADLVVWDANWAVTRVLGGTG